METIDPDLIAKDAADLRQSYDATLATLDRTWRRLAVEASPQRRATLERRAWDLVHEARLVATAHERATRALQKVGGDG